MDVLRQGGNAIDAGVAMGFCCAVLEPHLNGIGGESPILIYHAPSHRVITINGQGVAPRSATIQWFKAHGYQLIPGDGFLPATVPSQVDNWIRALARFGTCSLKQVLSPAVELARNGLPMYHGLSASLSTSARRFLEQWPTSAAIYLPEGRPPQWGDRLRNPDWAGTMDQLIEAEHEHTGQGRTAALEKARDLFYKGSVAEKLVAFFRDTKVLDGVGGQHNGRIGYDDLAAYHAQVEEPVCIDYQGLTIHKCGPWPQGPVFLQQLQLLDGFDLKALGHNSTDYVHTWIECVKRAFADRESYLR